jgi:putative restriction endonuclease
MRKASKNWSEQELILAFNLYCRLSFGQYHRNNKKVIELAQIIGRTPSAVALKLCNFARFDPYHKKRRVKGMRHGSKLEEKVWNEFNRDWEELAYQSQLAIASLEGGKHHDLAKSEETFLEGREKEAFVKVRLTQRFFREMVLSSYRTRCAVCSLPEESILIAGHIIPWSINASLRMNPRNGICMCALHDKAFDKGLISITDDFKLAVSKTIKRLHNEVSIQRGFLVYEGVKIRLPDRFVPDGEFIEFHRTNIFVG